MDIFSLDAMASLAEICTKNRFECGDQRGALVDGFDVHEWAAYAKKKAQIASVICKERGRLKAILSASNTNRNVFATERNDVDKVFDPWAAACSTPPTFCASPISRAGDAWSSWRKKVKPHKADIEATLRAEAGMLGASPNRCADEDCRRLLPDSLRLNADSEESGTMGASHGLPLSHIPKERLSFDESVDGSVDGSTIDFRGGAAVKGIDVNGGPKDGLEDAASDDLSAAFQFHGDWQSLPASSWQRSTEREASPARVATFDLNASVSGTLEGLSAVGPAPQNDCFDVDEVNLVSRIRSFKSHGWDPITENQVVEDAFVLADVDIETGNGSDVVKECAKGVIVKVDKVEAKCKIGFLNKEDNHLTFVSIRLPDERVLYPVEDACGASDSDVDD